MHTGILTIEDHEARAAHHQYMARAYAEHARANMQALHYMTSAECAARHAARARFHLFAAIDLARLAAIEAECARTDKAWSEAYEAICPRGMWPGDFRYTDAAKGAPGSALRAVYDARCRAFAARADFRSI